MRKRLPEIRVVEAKPAIVVFEFFDPDVGPSHRFTMRASVARDFAREIVEKANEADAKRPAG